MSPLLRGHFDSSDEYGVHQVRLMTESTSTTAFVRQLRFRIRRYALPEILGTCTNVLAVAVTSRLNWSTVAVALAGTWSENIGFYGTRILFDLRRRHEVGGTWKAVRNLLLEFGPPEMLDTFLSRPALMAVGISITGQPQLGGLLGKFLADAIFYTVATLSDESRKIIFEEQEKGKNLR